MPTGRAPRAEEAEIKVATSSTEDTEETRLASPPPSPTAPESKKARCFQRGGGRSKPAVDKAVKATPQIDLFLRPPKPTAPPTNPGPPLTPL